MGMQQIILALFPSIALIVAGYWSHQKQWLAADFWAGAEKLNYYVLFPSLLFLSLSSASIAWEQVSKVVWTMLLVLAMVVLVLFVWQGLRGIVPARFGVFVQSNIRFNTYIGMAIVSTLAQGVGSSVLAVVLAICIPLVNVVSVVSLLPKENMNVLAILRSLLKNPLITSCLVGMVVNVLDWHLWAGWVQLLKLLSNSSLTLGLLCVGAALQFQTIRDNWQAVLVNSGSKLVFIPLLAWGGCRLMGLDGLSTQVLVLFFALPTASAAYILTKVLRGDAPLMAGVISLQTLLSVLSLPVWIYLTRF